MRNMIAAAAIFASLLAVSACSLTTSSPQPTPVIVQQPANAPPGTVFVPRTY